MKKLFYMSLNKIFIILNIFFMSLNKIFIIFNIFRQNMKNYKKILLNSTPRTGLQIHCSQLKIWWGDDFGE